MTRSYFVAGGSGALGREVIRLLVARGDRVRAWTRDPARLAGVAGVEPVMGPGLAQHLAGVDEVFSCLGASSIPDPRRGWRGFGAVDLAIHRDLVAAAGAAGVRKLTYVSVHHTPAMRKLAYVDAHERVVDLLRGGKLRWSVVRPTGFFSAVGTYLDMARRGRVPLIGRPEVRSNPIHDADLAAACVEAMDGDAAEVAAGGPDVLSRREIGELAFAALSRKPRFVVLPAWLVKMMGGMARPLLPRVGQLMKFFATIGELDLVAPVRGQKRLGDFFRATA